MSSKLPAAKRQRTMETRSASLKQGTLSFGSSKRTGSGASSGSKDEKEKLKREEASMFVELPSNRFNALSPIQVDDSSSDSDARVSEISDEERYEVAPSPVKKRTKKALPVTTKAKQAAAKKKEEEEEDIEDADELDVKVKEEPLKTLNLKIIKPYKKLYESAKAKMGYMDPIHAEGQTKYHEILRVFDFEYKYGPCVGMTRLERWERANNLGLDPPREVHDILTTKEGVGHQDLAQCVLNGEV
ncbi:hypothetical protein CONPUDRAFT_159228 [Coniophora puteana RWD-64-598 SS2]|uniref:DNA polymerase delta subunit 4 n=1 Tax=Coniophora puteana (strain RWD-64-598) TaxID=741705 RepID=A0A5M3M891_CONPW|nr:uncharacterized protein CONPUDRAFT_159228 [Coniophora puteana RWD-64-598 SS2]EIW75094.1 hypothetical protein CONPUDRAFT_159228 [Coniophora puteana RWD-64-598 SS2]